MRIFNSQSGDPMMLDTVQGLKEFRRRFADFLASGEATTAFVAETSGSPEPYEEFLSGLRVRKAESDPELCLADDNWLELSAQPKELGTFQEALSVESDGDHNHYYCSPVSLIIEADESWPGWERS
jgi:hypothetical protein